MGARYPFVGHGKQGYGGGCMCLQCSLTLLWSIVAFARLVLCTGGPQVWAGFPSSAVELVQDLGDVNDSGGGASYTRRAVNAPRSDSAYI